MCVCEKAPFRSSTLPAFLGTSCGLLVSPEIITSVSCLTHSMATGRQQIVLKENQRFAKFLLVKTLCCII